MTVSKITSPVTPLEEVAKINEVIDAIPTESTVSGWGFTKNAGTVTSVNNVSPVNGNVSLTIPTVNNATLTITQGGTTKGTFTANASSNVTIDLDAGGGSSGSSRNVGEIIQSTIPLTDAGLHLLDGSVINGSGSYSAFVTHIAGLVSGHSELFTTEANWQTSVTNYGVCGKFVYDSVNNTVRLPKYSDKIWSGLGTAGVKGNGMTLGMTDGNNNGGLYGWSSGDVNAFASSKGNYGKNIGIGRSGSINLNTGKTLGITTDGTKSGMIVDLSTITTALDGYWYIVIATSTKTQIEVDIDEIAADLNGKADVDLSNMNPTQTVKNTIVGWGMPDYTAGVAVTFPYTCPSDGIMYIRIRDGAIVLKTNLTGTEAFTHYCPNINYATTQTFTFEKGQIITKEIDSSAGAVCIFYPFKGAN